jgi:LexA-binding, inner membrane-associated putative hydrolase
MNPMANFKTHLSVASTCSGMLAIGCLEAGLATPREVLAYFAAGTMGGILPDIDSDHSTPIQLIFSAFAVVLAFLTVFSKVGAYSIVELALLWLFIYVGIRHVASTIFATFTVHRGIFHSLLAALFFWLLTTAVTYHVFALSPFTAWLTGCFVGLGYVIHLLLDELYSVDLMGASVKRSFGTAVKVVSFTHMKATILLSLATLCLLYFATPQYDVLLHTLGNWRIYNNLQHKLLPKDRWFPLQR